MHSFFPAWDWPCRGETEFHGSGRGKGKGEERGKAWVGVKCRLRRLRTGQKLIFVRLQRQGKNSTLSGFKDTVLTLKSEDDRMSQHGTDWAKIEERETHLQILNEQEQLIPSSLIFSHHLSLTWQ